MRVRAAVAIALLLAVTPARSAIRITRDGEPAVPDILETAPLSVLLGPPPFAGSAGPGDIFRLPQFRNVPRKPVTGGLVVFGR